jgi:aldehyde dehydrogenase (NAD+)
MTTASSTPLALTPTEDLRERARRSLEGCGVTVPSSPSPSVNARTPITGEELFAFPAGRAEVEAAVAAAKEAFARWRTAPAPVRGAVVKRLSALLTEHKDDVADLITIETAVGATAP